MNFIPRPLVEPAPSSKQFGRKLGKLIATMRKNEAQHQTNMSTNTPEKPDYGEPWEKYDENGIQSRDEFWIADVKTPSIRDRIAACVNACAGMDDPAKEIEAMGEAIKAAHEHLSYAQGKHRILTRNRVVKALAKLEPFIKP